MFKRSIAPVLFVFCAAIAMIVAPPAFAVGWETTADVYPTHLPPGGTGTILVSVLDVGAEDSQGPVTVTDVLPSGVTATSAGGNDEEVGEPVNGDVWSCTTVVGSEENSVVTCMTSASLAGGGGIPDAFSNVTTRIAIAVKVAPGASGTHVNRVTVAGGGAATTASTVEPIMVSSAPAAFGVSDFDAWFSNANGTIDTQAGSHPYAATFTLDFNTVDLGSEPGPGQAKFHPAGGAPGGYVRNIEVELPPGLIGDPNAVPRCPRQQFDGNLPRCPLATQVGILQTINLGATTSFPVYNLVPPPGKPFQLALSLAGITTYLDAGPRTGGDNGITVDSDDVPERGIKTTTLTIWGVPSDPSHDRWRGEGTGGSSNASPKPLLTLPTACAGPQKFSVRVNSWGDEAYTERVSFLSHDSNDNPVGFTGCEHLGFGPAIKAKPDTANADTPAGLTVEVTPSIGGLSDPTLLSTADIQNTTVTLPEGLAINPGQAAGLAACQSYQDGVGTENAPSCPAASKVGVVSIETPLLKDKLEGNVYILQSNPPNLELLVAVSGDGVNLKLVGQVHLDESTGRLTTTFSGTPELPFTNFKLSFSGGAQAALATPAMCGSYTTTSDFTPWSSPLVPDALPSSSFSVEAGPGGGPCPSQPLPFGPQLIAGSTTDQAGGFTNFSLLLQAPDDQQRIERLQFKVPQGLLGMISQVPLCPEPQAQDGTCSAVSQIGHTVVASGPGPYPLVVPQLGQPPAAIYLTGPYKGAPYGLSIVVPIVVGPFTLQTQIVRAKIEVDQLTAQITVTTDQLPQVIDGVPTDLRTINAVIDRPGFMFNPTNCNPMSFSGTAWGTPPPGVGGPGSTAAISSHFQMGSCQALKFKPDFRVSTAGKTSRKNGASLDVKVLYPTGPLGNNQASSQSNIAQVKVDLPKQLPSRLTTLQKACTAATFEANPAGCPAASRVGEVTAVTPVLPVKLTGPAYFVSYGGAKFPELVFVLQGYGVTVQVHAETFISKAGITSSTLRHVPDVPITSFELKLPQGPFSALAANGNLCTSKLKMPTAFTAQNGAVIHQNTSISVTGCARVKKKGKKAGVRGKSGKHGKK